MLKHRRRHLPDDEIIHLYKIATMSMNVCYLLRIKSKYEPNSMMQQWKAPFRARSAAKSQRRESKRKVPSYSQNP